MHTLYIDIETRSGVDLRKSNVYRYVEDPQFEILLTAWAIDDGPVRIAEGVPDEVARIILDPTVLKVAHNAGFERVCFSPRGPACECVTPGGYTLRGIAWCCSKCDRPGHVAYLDPAQWSCSMALAAEAGRPQSLEKLAAELEGEQKDTAGTRLINLFCKAPFASPAERPAEWADFMAYCAQDVETLRSVHRALPDWPTREERLLWEQDQRMNDRGFPIDVELARAAQEAAADNEERHAVELQRLLGVDNARSVVQVLPAIRALPGLEGVDNLRAETIATALATASDPVAIRALELRQELALSASKKFTAALENVCADGRVRGAFRFFGAHTGRWSGRGFQPQNLPRAQFDSEAEVEAAILDLKLGLGAEASDLKKLVRPLWQGPFTVYDLAAIEARVVAWLAGEEWALQAFRDGRDIYVETAVRMGILTQDEALLGDDNPVYKAGRAKGKVAVLALGYQGWVNSIRALGYGDGMSDEEIAPIAQAWRATNQAIVQLWPRLEYAFRNGGRAGPHLRVTVDGASRYLELPSGRAIAYHNVVKGKELTFGKNPRTFTYGGKLTENATQAVARDVLAAGLLELDNVVGHVHDEVIIEGGSVAAVDRVFSRPLSWAPGLMVAGKGFQCNRYRKD